MKPDDIERELANEIAKFKHDFLGFVQFAFPWGEPASSLERFIGPQAWQADLLVSFGSAIRSDRQKGMFAVASGKGIGKSALVAQTTLAAIATFPDTRGVITAGTEPQLRTKTMPELSKWFEMMICKHWFNNPATSLYSRDPGHEKTWRIDAIPWNANNPEAFAGLHNFGKRILVVFDEASQIDDKIWDTTDGILTDRDTEVLWPCFGNPTRGSGRFFRCFGDLRHRWVTRQIDSREVQIADKEEIQAWVDDYGEDSDYVRMMVRGMFPRQSSMQFIATDVIAEARKREPTCNLSDPLIFGVDVARFGDDTTVIAVRKGRDARTIPWIKLRSRDNMEVAARIAEMHDRYKPDTIFVDSGGGTGVIDRLRQLGINAVEVAFGGAADRSQMDLSPIRYANKRSEMWGYMAEWLKHGAVPDDPELENETTGVYYTYADGKQGSGIMLEKKEHMKKRGLPSPDNADALALTFAYPVAPKRDAGGPHRILGRQIRAALTEYNPIWIDEAEERARETA